MPPQEAATATVGDGASTNGRSQPAADRRLLIDGQLVTANRVFSSVNPATGAVIGHAPDAGIEEARRAIAAARRAFDTTTWSTDTAFRVRCLDQLHQALLDHAEELRELTIAEGRDPRPHPGRPTRRVKIVRYYADLLRTQRISLPNTRTLLSRNGGSQPQAQKSLLKLRWSTCK